MNWTKEQLQAINEKGNNILVAAAAGSGKTAVLVERIINKIINEKIDIDRLLVVTFTNAAASEMREKILNAIYKKVDENPEDINLQRQITLLNKSSICTIDSFCIEVVRNHFYELDNISPNFKIAETSEVELLKQEILEEMFEEKYESEDKDFQKLITTYTSYKDDTPLKDMVLKIYSYIQSNPFPLKWLDEKIEMFNLSNKLDMNFGETIWGEVLCEAIDEILIETIMQLKEAENLMAENVEFDACREILESDIKKVKYLKDNISDWDKALEIFNNLTFETWSRKAVTDKETKDRAKQFRDSAKNNMSKKIAKILNTSSSQIMEDINNMYPILLKLKNFIIEFDQKFTNAKIEKNIMDFNDTEHYALQILQNEDIAKKYRNKYYEIAIDEYQDSNLVQETILNSISRGNNIFMVGDVKQSIYKFRQAMPTLFLDKYEKYKLPGEESQEGIKIQLFKNFRSRENILGFTNLIFENIMSSLLGEIEYTKEEYLNYGAEYKTISNQNLKTEIDVINIEKQNEEELDEEQDRIEKDELEAKFVASRIKELINSKFQVYDNKTEAFRDITYKDIVVLMRSKSNTAAIYEQEMLDQNIPVFSEASTSYLESLEIETVMALLKLIDNPIQDIPLVTVLRSNIVGITDNELVDIRLVDRYSDFYTCLQKAKAQVDEKLREKITKFLEQLQAWRKEQEYLSLDEFIWKIYSDTGFFDFVGTMPNGEFRQANLKLLIEKAKQYESSSFKGLYNFIKFIEKIQLNFRDSTSAKIIGEKENVVRLMTIHKSKGLEFPVVFLANSGKKFNLQDLSDNILLHQDLGLGVKFIDYDTQIKYDTMAKIALMQKVLNESLSEEMRILYVALTRAKEKLIITGVKREYSKLEEELEQVIEIFPKSNGKINPALLKQNKHLSYLNWILLVCKYNLVDLFDVNVFEKDKLLRTWKNEMSENKQEVLTTEQEARAITKEETFEYKHKLATTIPTKTSVSDIKQKANEEIETQREISFAKPLFMKENVEEKITGSQRGTLVHLCMQKLNPKVEYDLQKVRELISNLVAKEIITSKEAEAINPNVILQFTKSKIWKELITAKMVEHEKPFYINIPARDIYEEADENTDEMVLVQGVIDLYYQTADGEYVLVDYKTDYVEQGQEEELIKKYLMQLQIYKTALEYALGKQVARAYIYSTRLGTINVDI